MKDKISFLSAITGIEKGIEQKTKESAIELHNFGIEDEKIIQALHVSQD